MSYQTSGSHQYPSGVTQAAISYSANQQAVIYQALTADHSLPFQDQQSFNPGAYGFTTSQMPLPNGSIPIDEFLNLSSSSEECRSMDINQHISRQSHKNTSNSRQYQQQNQQPHHQHPTPNNQQANLASSTVRQTTNIHAICPTTSSANQPSAYRTQNQSMGTTTVAGNPSSVHQYSHPVAGDQSSARQYSLPNAIQRLLPIGKSTLYANPSSTVPKSNQNRSTRSLPSSNRNRSTGATTATLKQRSTEVSISPLPNLQEELRAGAEELQRAREEEAKKAAKKQARAKKNKPPNNISQGTPSQQPSQINPLRIVSLDFSQLDRVEPQDSGVDDRLENGSNNDQAAFDGVEDLDDGITGRIGNEGNHEHATSSTGLGMVNDVSPSTNATNDQPSAVPNLNKRMRLAPHLIEELNRLETDELRVRVDKHAHYTRLCADDKVALEELHSQFQRQVLLFTGSRKLRLESVQSHLGTANRARGSSMYHNFCRYEPEAHKIRDDKSLSIQEKGAKYGALWRGLDSSTQEKYKDPLFLQTLPNPFIREHPTAEGANTEHPTAEGANTNLPENNTDQGKTKSHKSTSGKGFDVNRWSHKILVDLKNLQIAHGIEGYLVVVYPHLKGRAVLSGGSSMGEAFLDMFAVDPNPTGAFLDFVKGILATQKVSGAEEAPLPPKKRKRATTSSQLTLESCRDDLGAVARIPGGKDVDHLHAVREKLKYALFKASHGVWRKGWPGKDTQQKLAKLKIVLCVQPNALSVTPADFCGRSASISQGNAERLHTAIENGWVELRGPPVVDTVQNLGDTSEDQTETQTNESNRLRVPVGAMPPSVTIKAKKKRQPKGTSSRLSTTTSQEKNPSSSSKSNAKAIQNKNTTLKSKSDARQGVVSKKNKKRKTGGCVSNDESESAVSSGRSDDDGDVEEELMQNYQEEDEDDHRDDQDEHEDQDNQGGD